APDEARVAVTERDGRVRSARAIYEGGAGAWKPDELETKFMRHAGHALGRAGAEALRALVLRLESVGDSAEVTLAGRGAGRKPMPEPRVRGGGRGIGGGGRGEERVAPPQPD